MGHRYEPTSETPIQNTVGILHDLFMGNFNVTAVGGIDITDQLMENARIWLELRLLDEGFNREQVRMLTDDHEGMENTPIYDAYYRLRGQFVRKALTAAANAL